MDAQTGAASAVSGHPSRTNPALPRSAENPSAADRVPTAPTGEFAKKVDAVRRAREAEEAIPKEHIPRPWLVLQTRWSLPSPRIRKRCRGCRHMWPCRSLTKYLRFRHGDDIRLALFRLSTRRLRARADRRSDTAITHRA